MKHHNPHTPIMIREALDVQPRVWARYEFGREKMTDLKGTQAYSRAGVLIGKRTCLGMCAARRLTRLQDWTTRQLRTRLRRL